ncbi:MAG: hypothetical protein HOW73_17835, partial [Polyangiaceae bacterium]|nr:hypothetical protein [Polyangiaceae bacterium]
MKVQLASRYRATAFAAGLCALAVVGHARADDSPEDGESEKEELVVRKVHLDRDDDSEEKVVIVKKKGHRKAPEVGDDPEVIEEYLDDLKEQRRDLRAQLKEANRDGDADLADQLKEELRELDKLEKEEQGRLTTSNRGLVAGGAVLVAAGGVSLIASIAFLLVAENQRGVSGYDAGGWSCLALGIGGIAGGSPMIA